MTPEQHLEALAAESANFASATAGSLDMPIDFIEGWTIRDLVAHLGAVYSTVIANAAAGSAEITMPGDEAKAPEGEAINAWFAERRTTLLATLSGANDDAIAWTFTGTKTVAWWKRRIAHETAVHRWDADAAIEGIDAAPPIDSDLATDGVNEFLDVSLRFSQRRPNRIYPTETLHLHRDDGPGEWMLTGDGGSNVTVTHEHGKGDAAVRGPASSLVLWVWGRPVTDVEIFGDETVANTWRDLAP